MPETAVPYAFVDFAPAEFTTRIERARRLINNPGCKIWVESESGAGCKFSFIIPLTPAAATAKGKS